MNETFDIDKLREDLMSYFGTASFYNKPAMIDLIEVENASDEEIVNIAIQNGFDIQRYEVSKNIEERR